MNTLRTLDPMLRAWCAARECRLCASSVGALMACLGLAAAGMAGAWRSDALERQLAARDRLVSVSNRLQEAQRQAERLKAEMALLAWSRGQGLDAGDWVAVPLDLKDSRLKRQRFASSIRDLLAAEGKTPDVRAFRIEAAAEQGGVFGAQADEFLITLEGRVWVRQAHAAAGA